MVDLGFVFDHLNLSPLNTVLLALLLYFFRGFLTRLDTLERTVNRHTVSLAIVKDRLDIEEEAD